MKGPNGYPLLRLLPDVHVTAVCNFSIFKLIKEKEVLGKFLV